MNMQNTKNKKKNNVFFFLWLLYNAVFCLLIIAYIFGLVVGLLTLGNAAFLETSPYFYTVFLIQLILPFLSLFNIFSTSIFLLKSSLIGKFKILGIIILLISIFFVLNILILY